MILDINPDYTGQVGILPRTVKILSDDDFDTITTAGYLNSVQQQGINFYPTDVFFISYADNAFDIFLPTFSGNLITLVPNISEGNVTFPVTNNHLAKFSGTDGTIADSGIAVASVPTVTTPVVSGNIPKFSGTAGAIIDASIAAANIQLKSTIVVQEFNYAGGSTSTNFVLTGITTSAILGITQKSVTNAAYIVSYSLSPNTITVTWNTNPGTTVLSIIVFAQAQ